MYVMDIIAYIGTALLLSSSLIKRRKYLHIIRIVGNALWLVYAFAIMNWPLIITDSVAIVIDLVAIFLYGKDK